MMPVQTMVRALTETTTDVVSAGEGTGTCGPLDESVTGLPYGELAAALYVSDMPTRQRRAASWSLGDLAYWVCQGVVRLGGQRAVWELDYRSRQAVACEDWAAYGLIWPDETRNDCAHDAASWFKEMAGMHRPEMVMVPVRSVEHGIAVYEQRDARDVRFAAAGAGSR
jgi:hypothetical protein